VCRAYAEAVQAGLEAGQETEAIFTAAFSAMSRTAVEVAPTNALRGKLMHYVLGHHRPFGKKSRSICRTGRGFPRTQRHRRPRRLGAGG
jgi:hypothetical protein